MHFFFDEFIDLTEPFDACHYFDLSKLEGRDVADADLVDMGQKLIIVEISCVNIGRMVSRK